MIAVGASSASGVYAYPSGDAIGERRQALPLPDSSANRPNFGEQHLRGSSARADSAGEASVSTPAAVYSDPRRQEQQRLQRDLVANEQRQQQLEIKALAQRDREVRAHEQAHVAVGGQYAGAARYQFERGPNGVSYAVGGEVSISTGKEATPQETLHKAQVVKRAALAPAEPSAQDRQVAAAAGRLEAQAKLELAQEQQQQQQQLVRNGSGDIEPHQKQSDNPGVPNAAARTWLSAAELNQSGPGANLHFYV